VKRITAFIIFLSGIITSCVNRDEKIVKYIDTDALYFDYQVWGDDDKQVMTLMLQFRQGDAEGKPVALQLPAKVELDNRQLNADSTKMSGVYYDYATTVDSFSGKHSIVLTANSGEKYTEKFEFHPFNIVSAWPDTIHRNGFSLEFSGLDKEDFIRIIALDTVFKSNGINDVDTVKDGKMMISAQQLKNLASGPVRIEFYKEAERPLKNSTTAGGYLLVTYAVKRNFILAD
jgi:hypothetical protein